MNLIKEKYVGLTLLPIASLIILALAYPPTPAPAAAQQIIKQEATPLITNPNIFVQLSQKVIPSVVNISATMEPHRRQNRSQNIYRNDFEKFFGLRPPREGWGQRSPQFSYPGSAQRQALGTGVVVNVKGGKAYIVTNNHVIDQADRLKIQFSEGVGPDGPIEGKIIGTDKDLDIALIEIKIEKKWNIKALEFGDSEKLQVGEYVMAVGNPFGQGHSVSHGIISAKGRAAPVIGSWLQTDAPINPGHSGGPLVNLEGKIIGINNAILAQAQGIGFAIPSNSVQPIIEELKNNGKVQRGFIGLMMGQISPEAAAFSGEEVKSGQPYVVDVAENSPAEQAGIKPNDIILSFNKKRVKNPLDLKTAVAMSPLNEELPMKVYRSGKSKTLKIKVKKKDV